MSTTTLAIDAEARDKALSVASAAAEDLNRLEQRLAYLTGFFGDDYPLGRALVGALGIRVTEMHQQYPALRQAIKDIPLLGDRS